jgi:hypothetical protein
MVSEVGEGHRYRVQGHVSSCLADMHPEA